MADREHRQRKISIFTLLVTTISIAVAFALVLSVSAFVSIYNTAALKNAATFTEQSVTQVAATLNTYSEDMQRDMKSMAADLAGMADRTEAERYLESRTRLREDLAAIFIYSADGRMLSCHSPGQVLKQNQKSNLSVTPEVLATAQGYTVLGPHVQNVFQNYYPWVVTIAGRQSISCFGTNVVLAMDYKFSGIATYVDSVGIGEHGYCYVVSNNDAILYHPQQQLLFLGLKQENTADLSEGVTLSKRDKSIYAVRSLKNGIWKVVGVSLHNELVAADVRRVALTVTGIALAVMGALLGLIVLYSRVVSNPIRSLSHAMAEFEQNAAGYEYMERYRISEMDMLSRSFGHMVVRIKELMEQIKKEEISLRKTELKALQAQINPHFLYNTLDSIQWMCEQNRMQDAVQMVGALARLFRISINRGNEFVTLAQELDHARSYLLIQSYRYKNQFRYRFEVQEDILNFRCNKITLQPIIENAIYHGISRMVDEGEIVISAKGEGGDIVLRVRDNGVGMTAEQCREIMKKESGHSGIGLKNVGDRLKIYFGEAYGITVQSEPDAGTTVTVRFPKVEDSYEL